MSDRTTFLNVDLDVVADEDLQPLADALSRTMFALHVGRVGRRHRASFELRRSPRTPDIAIRRLVAAVKTLSRADRARWRRATTRDFNIGIQSAAEPRATELALGASTVRLVSEVGGRIVITVYGSSLADGQAE